LSTFDPFIGIGIGIAIGLDPDLDPDSDSDPDSDPERIGVSAFWLLTSGFSYPAVLWRDIKGAALG